MWRPFAAVVLLDVGAASAQDFDAGMRAYLLSDREAAIEIWRPLADAGNTDAQFMIGQAAYETYNYALALQEWIPLAESEDPRAQHGLGYMYYFGEGVLEDYIIAHMWFNIACAVSMDTGLKSQGGSYWGCSERDAVALELSPADKTEAQQLARRCMTSNYSRCNGS